MIGPRFGASVLFAFAAGLCIGPMADVFNEYALEFIRQGQQSDKPWFLFLGHSSPHFPVQAPAQRADKYYETYLRGWDAFREERFARMKKMGLVDGDHWQLSPRSIVPVDRDDIANGFSGKLNPAWNDLNQAKDRTELNDLASQKPDLRDRLAKLWLQMAGDVDQAPSKRRTPLLETAKPVANSSWSSFDTSQPGDARKARRKRRKSAPTAKDEKPATVEKDLVTPLMTGEAPAAGKRVRQVAPEYKGTDVYHSLYLPVDWKPDGKYPVIVEYTGNKFPAGKGSGEVKDANLGYGMSGGRGFIWVVMPYVEKGREKNAVKWWGDTQATIDYCKFNLPRICQQFGGDPDNVFVCGFSRGAIGASYIGLADDEIASLWRGMFTHDHFDGQKKWGYPESDRASALKRLARLKGRPVLICGQRASNVRDQYLKDHLDLARFTFRNVPTKKILKIPQGQFIHSHTDLWMHRESKYRQQARAWLQSVLKEKRH